MNSELAKKIVEVTLEDIERVQSFELPKNELSHYWLNYAEEVPRHLRVPISQYIFHQTQVKVLWITGQEVKIELY